MGYSVGQVKTEKLTQFLEPWDEPELEEIVEAGKTVIGGSTTTPSKIAEGSVPAGYDGVVMGIACTNNADVTCWIKRAEKQVYANGLHSSGLPANLRETPLFAKLKEKQKWELGLTNVNAGAQTVYWLIRVRHIKKAA